MFPQSRFYWYTVPKQHSNSTVVLERLWIWISNLLNHSVLPSPGDIVSISTPILFARIDPTVVRQWERDCETAALLHSAHCHISLTVCAMVNPWWNIRQIPLRWPQFLWDFGKVCCVTSINGTYKILLVFLYVVHMSYRSSWLCLFEV